MEAHGKVGRFFAGLLSLAIAFMPAAFLYNDPPWSKGSGLAGFLKHLVIREMALGLLLVSVAAAWHYWLGQHPIADRLLRRGLPWAMLAILAGLALIWFGQFLLLDAK